MGNAPQIYRLDDRISFRKCSLYDGEMKSHGDCTNYAEIERNWQKNYSCEQQGIHLHCTVHPAIELEFKTDDCFNRYLSCPKCHNCIEIDDFKLTIKKCLRMLNIETLKDATLVRLDDWYVPEIKKKVTTESDYWITTNVKTDKDGDTVIILYVGHKGSNEKAQFFIKPEKLQLTSDHKDLDPAKILSKIEVTLKDRKLTHKYE